MYSLFFRRVYTEILSYNLDGGLICKQIMLIYCI